MIVKKIIRKMDAEPRRLPSRGPSVPLFFIRSVKQSIHRSSRSHQSVFIVLRQVCAEGPLKLQPVDPGDGK